MKKAFTLIELIVVVSFIALLTGILCGALGVFRHGPVNETPYVAPTPDRLPPILRSVVEHQVYEVSGGTPENRRQTTNKFVTDHNYEVIGFTSENSGNDTISFTIKAK